MKDIREYKDIYSTFMKLKDRNPQQEYTVTAGRKAQVKNYGNNSSRK